MGESRIELAASLGFESSRMQRQYGFKPKKNPIEGSSHEVKEKNKEVQTFTRLYLLNLKITFSYFKMKMVLRLYLYEAIRLFEYMKIKRIKMA